MRLSGLRATSFWGALALMIGAPVLMAEDKDWSAEVGVSAGHTNNFFSRGTGKERLGTDFWVIYGKGEIERDAKKGKFKFYGGAEGTLVSDIDNADHQRFDLGAQYKYRRYRISADFFVNPDRLALFDLRQVSYDIQGYGLNFRRALRRGVWVRLNYELQDWDYEAIENQRDADKETVGLTLRLPLGERAGIRGTVFLATREAEAVDFNWDGQGFSLRFDTRWGDGLGFSLRYKTSDRDYEDAPIGDRNFERADTIEELSAQLRWNLGRRWVPDSESLGGVSWGVEFLGKHRTGDSTRLDRNFSTTRFQAGIYVAF